jgi:hypothetical protein
MACSQPLLSPPKASCCSRRSLPQKTSRPTREGAGVRTPSCSRAAVLSSLLAPFRVGSRARPSEAKRSLSRRYGAATAHGWIFGLPSGVDACEARFLVRRTIGQHALNQGLLFHPIAPKSGLSYFIGLLDELHQPLAVVAEPVKATEQKLVVGVGNGGRAGIDPSQLPIFLTENRVTVIRIEVEDEERQIYGPENLHAPTGVVGAR